MFLRSQHDFKIQLPLYILQSDWLIRLFPSSPFSFWVSLGVRGSLVQRSYRLEYNRMVNPPEKHGKIPIKTANTGDLWSRMKRSKTQYNVDAGKKIILLIYEHNVSHSSWLHV